VRPVRRDRGPDRRRLLRVADAPVKRVASTDPFVGYAPQLEDAILPQVSDFKRAIAELMAF
jgi:pyruvate/2-oxoglutarate/acetoin dehydrogenase E1 component